MTEQKFVAAPAGGAPAESDDDLDVPIIDDDMTDPTPAVAVADGADAAPVTPRSDESDVEHEPTKTRRARPKKMSLRIPDDEVARPSERVPVAAAVEEPPEPAISPSRIIAINPPSNPALSEESAEADADEAHDPMHDPMHDAPTHIKLPDSSDRVTPDPITSPSPKSESDIASDVSSAAVISSTSTSDLPEKPAENADLSADDGVDVQVDADDSVPDAAPEEPEIGADDLVSIESVPVPRHRSGPPAAPPVPALAYQSGEHPAQPTNGAASALSGPEEAPPVVIVTPAPAPVTLTGAAPAGAPPLTDAAKKRVRPWWEDLFNDDFVRTMAKISDSQIAREANFIEESLGVAKGSALLDLGCGTGLHAIELTRRGYQVVGFDLSLPMLARAADEAQERNQKINFVQGDMREMAFDEMFDGVYSWNTSFGYFEEEKNGQVVTRVHRALKKGGQFLLDVVNRDYIIKQSPSLAWFEGDGCICMDEMQIDFITSRMRIKRTMMMDDGRSREIEYSMRIYSLHELGKLLHEHGFRVAEVSGRLATPGVFFGNESPRTLILAEKR